MARRRARGHHLQNRTQVVAVFLVVGTHNDEDHREHSDIDMVLRPGRYARGGGSVLPRHRWDTIRRR